MSSKDTDGTLKKISNMQRQKEMRRTAYKQNGSARLLDNIWFRLKLPDMLYILKTSEKAWSLIFNLHCTVAKHLLKNCILQNVSLQNLKNCNAVYKLR